MFKHLFLLTFLLYSCGNSVEFKETPSFGDRSRFSQEELSFARIRESIMEPHCIKCHAGYGDYSAVFADKDKVLAAVNQNRMPKNAAPLSDELKGLLNAWVRQGAPEGTDSGTDDISEVKMLEPTWESLSRSVFFPKCVQCHNPQGQAKFLDLSTRQKFFENRKDLLNNFENVESSFLIEVITDTVEPMPPIWSGLDPLTEEEVAVVKEWIEKGLP